VSVASSNEQEVATGSGPSPLDAVADMRATAKWIVAAAAAVGSLLLGTAPLAAIGRVQDLYSAALAFAGLGLALSGVGIVIWFTAEALTPPITTLATLSEPRVRDLRLRMARDPAPFFGPFGRNADELQSNAGLHAMAAVNLAVLLVREEDTAHRMVLTQALADANANAALARHLLRRLLEFVHVWQVRRALRRARTIAMVGIILGAFGTVIFLLGVGSTS